MKKKKKKRHRCRCTRLDSLLSDSGRFEIDIYIFAFRGSPVIIFRGNYEGVVQSRFGLFVKKVYGPLSFHLENDKRADDTDLIIRFSRGFQAIPKPFRQRFDGSRKRIVNRLSYAIHWKYDSMNFVVFCAAIKMIRN